MTSVRDGCARVSHALQGYDAVHNPRGAIGQVARPITAAAATANVSSTE
jgi:hypothetical protein